MTVKQASQVLDVLEFFAARRSPATLADVCDHFRWPRSSTFNLLSTLAERGYLVEPRPRGGHYPSPKWSAVVERIREGEPTPPQLQALLEELADIAGETAVLAAASGGNAVFIHVVESRHAVRYSAAIGKLVPLHASATGRALLAQRPPAERAAALRKAAYTAYTPTTLMSADAVEAEILRSMARGWFEGHSEFSLGLGGLALSLPLPPRNYAVLIAGPEERMAARFEPLARQARAIIEDRLQIRL